MGHEAHTAELVLFVVGLLLVAAATLALSRRIKFPFTVALVVVGVVLAQLAGIVPQWLGVVTRYEVAPEIILFVFLPTLIYESSFHLNARQLRHNLWPVLTLAVPGLLFSTLIIGLIVYAATPIELPAALLLGSILSATDPVAVISLFKQLGAPKRLTVLVEGESLFNDATAIVLSRILIGIIAAGYFAPQMIWQGTMSFVLVFFGGIVVGLAAAWLFGLLLGLVESDTFIEISLTTILAYLSFLVAEEIFHVSGVMATVAAGMTMGNWGRTKISPPVLGYLEHFWEYMAYVANALIFLLVGLRVDLSALGASFDTLIWVVLAMLISRALVIYLLVPLVGRLPGNAPIDSPYRAVMFWGGLRGAIALAIVLSLDDFAYADTFVAVVTGAVLFTLLIQGTTIEKLVRLLGLDQPPLADRLARSEGWLLSKRRALENIPTLQHSGIFSAHIAGLLQQKYVSEIEQVKRSMDQLKMQELDFEQERILLYRRCFAEERNDYYRLYSRGHLAEQAYRDLCYSIDLQEEAIQNGSGLPAFTLHAPGSKRLREKSYNFLEWLLQLSGLPEKMRMVQIAREYEEAWGRVQGSGHVLDELDRKAAEETVQVEVLGEVKSCYEQWNHSATAYLDSVAGQFPEFVSAMQENLAGRLLLHTQRESIMTKIHAGVIPAEVAEKILQELQSEIRTLRGSDLKHLQVDAAELLRKVPFFKGLPSDDFLKLVDKLHPYTAPAGREIIRQGATDDSLFLISRGVVRISRSVDGRDEDLATLLAGDFFGEMALLHGEPRTATCRTVAPAMLYELRSEDFREVYCYCPAIRLALEEADRCRKQELAEKFSARSIRH